MKVGFTGTQRGMTEQQKNLVAQFLDDNPVEEFHHGDCVGADAEAHVIVLESPFRIPTIIHPPLNSAKRAFCKGDQQRRPMEYLDRNKVIVRETQVLLATPDGPEELRSGTWSTIRYARKLGRVIHIYWPDGSQTLEQSVRVESHSDGVETHVSSS